MGFCRWCQISNSYRKELWALEIGNYWLINSCASHILFSHTPTSTHHSFPKRHQRRSPAFPDLFGPPPPRSQSLALESDKSVFLEDLTSHSSPAHTHTYFRKQPSPLPVQLPVFRRGCCDWQLYWAGWVAWLWLFKWASLIWECPVALWHLVKLLWHLQGDAELFSAVTPTHTSPEPHTHTNQIIPKPPTKPYTLYIHTVIQTPPSHACPTLTVLQLSCLLKDIMLKNANCLRNKYGHISL